MRPVSATPASPRSPCGTRCIHLQRPVSVLPGPCPAARARAPPTPSCKMLFSARGLARTRPQTGLQVVAARLQKAATGRPRNSARTTALDGPWRIAAPATTGTPPPAPYQRQSPVRGCYTRESGLLRRPWTGVRSCTPAGASSGCSSCDPRPQNPGAGDCPSSLVRRPQRGPTPVPPWLPVHPCPKGNFQSWRCPLVRRRHRPVS